MVFEVLWLLAQASAAAHSVLSVEDPDGGNMTVDRGSSSSVDVSGVLADVSGTG